MAERATTPGRERKAKITAAILAAWLLLLAIFCLYVAVSKGFPAGGLVMFTIIVGVALLIPVRRLARRASSRRGGSGPSPTTQGNRM